jgi:HD-GYP domain-containing protein (c-di-GMP phosphodiesterase class II)
MSFLSSEQIIPPQLISLGIALRQAMCNEVSPNFQLWIKNEDWCIYGQDESQLEATELQDNVISRMHLQSNYHSDAPSVVCLQSKQHLVVVPVRNSDGFSMAVCGIAYEYDQPMLCKFVKSLMLQNELQHQWDNFRPQIGAYAHQVTCDFEELTWLRGMAAHLEICDLRNSIATVAGKLLPNLQDLIRAQSIVLLDEHSVKNPATDLTHTQISPIFSTGNCPMSVAECINFARQLEPQVGFLPFVRNAESRMSHIPGTTGVHSLIAIRVAKGSYQFGWLLVFNKNLFEQPNAEDLFSAADMSTWEYGTFEAGLVGIAGMMLVTHARNMDLFHQQERLMIGIVRTMINAIDAKDTYTRGHSDRVASMAKRLGKQLGLNPTECEQLYMTGLLHDIGKIGIPDHILCKPDKLTKEEYEVIKRHPVIGYEILKHVQQFEYVLPGVLHHHESVDGTGYPGGLIGDQIPLSGRILAVVDAYDAMTSTRPYRMCMTREKAERILRMGAGKQWDMNVVNAFFAALSDMHHICELTDDDLHSVHDQINITEQPMSQIEETIRTAICTLTNA